MLKTLGDHVGGLGACSPYIGIFLGGGGGEF